MLGLVFRASQESGSRRNYKSTDVTVQYRGSGAGGVQPLPPPAWQSLVRALSPGCVFLLPRRDPSFLVCVITHPAPKTNTRMLLCHNPCVTVDTGILALLGASHHFHTQMFPAKETNHAICHIRKTQVPGFFLAHTQKTTCRSFIWTKTSDLHWQGWLLILPSGVLGRAECSSWFLSLTCSSQCSFQKL